MPASDADQLRTLAVISRAWPAPTKSCGLTVGSVALQRGNDKLSQGKSVLSIGVRIFYSAMGGRVQHH